MNPLIYHYEYEWSFTTIVCFEDRFEYCVLCFLFLYFVELLEPENDVIKKKDLWFVQVTNTVFTRYILDKMEFQ